MSYPPLLIFFQLTWSQTKKIKRFNSLLEGIGYNDRCRWVIWRHGKLVYAAEGKTSNSRVNFHPEAGELNYAEELYKWWMTSPDNAVRHVSDVSVPSIAHKKDRLIGDITDADLGHYVDLTAEVFMVLQ